MKYCKHVLVIAASCFSHFTLASTPNVIVSVGGNEYLAKRGLFGSKEEVGGELVLAPASDPLLCNYNGTQTASPLSAASILLVPRGDCSFEQKAHAARQLYGVVGVFIYDTLSARYGWDAENERVNFPRAQWDYECANGFGTMKNLALDPPKYNSTELDSVLSQGCTLQATRSPCESNLCVVTSHTKNDTDYPVCCAWDLPMTMGGDDSLNDDMTKDVVAVFLTIRQGKEIVPLATAVGAGGGAVGTITARPRSNFNISFLFIWLMAMFATLFGAWNGAKEYRDFSEKLAEYKAQHGTPTNLSGARDAIFDVSADEIDRDDELTSEPGNEPPFRDETSDSKGGVLGWAKKFGRGNKQDEPLSLRSIPPARKGSKTETEEPQIKSGKQAEGSWALHSIPPDKKRKKKKSAAPDESAIDAATRDVTAQTRAQSSGEDIDGFIPEGESAGKMEAELTQWHIFGFVASASIMLMLLFYFRFYPFIFVVYALGCAGAVSYLIFSPILVKVVPKLGDEVITELNKEVCCRQNGFDVTSQLAGFVWSGIWIWYGLSHYQPLTNWFFWITQDAFGITVSIMFIGALKLYSIKIATWFLVAVFFYDIFFVFITPYFTSNGQSVMLAVVGDSDTPIDDFCFKYPDDGECTGITSLPMILTFPHINDWTGGSAILGLGDILLPGFLVSFTARVDEAKRLLGRHTTIDLQVPAKWYQGYFFPLSVAYGIGLLITFSVLWSTGQGQPALLYLSPTCLITIFIVGRKEIKEMWNDSRTLRLADKLMKKCEKNWARQRMQRLIAKKRKERAGGGNAGQGVPPEQNQIERPSGGRKSNAGRYQPDGNNATGRGRGRDNLGGRGRNPRNPAGREGGGRRPVQRQNAGTRRRHSRGRKAESEGNDGGKAAGSQSDCIEVGKNDICVDNDSNPGNKALRRAAEKSVDTFGVDDFGPEVYKDIKKQLKGKRFLIRDGSQWRQAGKIEIRDAVERAFNEAKGS
ncbi:unnamed protein product [Cylindrotheca closterium]|uniref:PA domain-containing protein n=1 Tax=Cylindrotheca closterium TaxID=2856 RepID=A0AAD2G4L4_9STRA|nr:unnamed protein product [Cylindrotheca closterium]